MRTRARRCWERRRTIRSSLPAASAGLSAFERVGRLGKLQAFRLGLWLIAGVALAFVMLSYFFLPDRPPRPKVTSTGTPKIEARFSLIDGDGNPVSEQDYRGRPLLVFFGYTNCPDVCPTTLSTIVEVIDGLGKKAEKLRYLFITVDPVRDRPKVMANYTAAFHSKIIGLTGTPAQIESATSSFRVFYKKLKAKSTTEGYAMSHTAVTYLMDANGRYLAHFSYGDEPDKFLAVIRKYAK